MSDTEPSHTGIGGMGDVKGENNAYNRSKDIINSMLLDMEPDHAQILTERGRERERKR